jgi:hypothetical protein
MTTHCPSRTTTPPAENSVDVGVGPANPAAPYDTDSV